MIEEGVLNQKSFPNAIARILLVDDEQAIRDSLRMFFEHKGYCCETAQNGAIALECLKRDPMINLLITDLKMPLVSGLDLLKEAKQHNPFVEAIVLTGYPQVDTALTALKIGAFDYLSKPLDLREMLNIVERCLERQKRNVNHVSLSELAALFEVSRNISASGDIRSSLSLILDAAIGITDAACGVLTYEKNGIRDTIESGTVTAAIDPEANPIEASIPISFQNKTIGVLSIRRSGSETKFNEREMTILSVFAGQAAVAVENALLYEQLQSKISDLNAALEDLRRAQVQLVQSEKLAALGRFSTGLAHEVKNPLAIILGGVEYLQISMANVNDNTGTALEKVKDAALRANSILLRLLKFARPSELTVEIVKPEALISEALSLFKYRTPDARINIETSFKDNGVLVAVDKNQMQQVLFNVFANAIDAMPGGGVLRIRSFEQPCDPALDNRHSCVLEVSDTGSGIAPEHLAKIFEPFFTTKRDTKGTGLGLAISKMIVENHKGRLSITSETGRGTSVRIALPAYAQEGQ